MPKIAESALFFRVFWVQLASSDSDGERGEPRSMLGGAGVGEGADAYRSAIPPAVLFWGSSFNDGTTQTARDPLILGGRLAPLKSVYFGSNEGRGPVPSVQP